MGSVGQLIEYAIISYQPQKQRHFLRFFNKSCFDFICCGLWIRVTVYGFILQSPSVSIRKQDESIDIDDSIFTTSQQHPAARTSNEAKNGSPADNQSLNFSFFEPVVYCSLIKVGLNV